MCIDRQTSDVAEFDESVLKFLRKEEAGDVKFIVAVDPDGKETVFVAPGTKARILSEKDFAEGVSAKIKGVSSSALVRFEGSNCYIREVTINGQRVWVKVCW